MAHRAIPLIAFPQIQIIYYVYLYLRLCYNMYTHMEVMHLGAASRDVVTSHTTLIQYTKHL